MVVVYSIRAPYHARLLDKFHACQLCLRGLVDGLNFSQQKIIVSNEDVLIFLVYNPTLRIIIFGYNY